MASHPTGNDTVPCAMNWSEPDDMEPVGGALEGYTTPCIWSWNSR